MHDRKSHLWQSNVCPAAVPDAEDVDELVAGVGQSLLQSRPLVVVAVAVMVAVHPADLARRSTIAGTEIFIIIFIIYFLNFGVPHLATFIFIIFIFLYVILQSSIQCRG